MLIFLWHVRLIALGSITHRSSIIDHQSSINQSFTDHLEITILGSAQWHWSWISTATIWSVTSCNWYFCQSKRSISKRPISRTQRNQICFYIISDNNNEVVYKSNIIIPLEKGNWWSQSLVSGSAYLILGQYVGRVFVEYRQSIAWHSST